MVLIVIPIAILSVILALTTYRSVIHGIETAQIVTTSNFAARTRVWFRGMLRSLVATVAAVEAIDAGGGQCATITRNALSELRGEEIPFPAE